MSTTPITTSSPALRFLGANSPQAAAIVAVVNSSPYLRSLWDAFEARTIPPGSVFAGEKPFIQLAGETGNGDLIPDTNANAERVQFSLEYFQTPDASVSADTLRANLIKDLAHEIQHSNTFTARRDAEINGLKGDGTVTSLVNTYRRARTDDELDSKVAEFNALKSGSHSDEVIRGRINGANADYFTAINTAYINARNQLPEGSTAIPVVPPTTVLRNAMRTPYEEARGSDQDSSTPQNRGLTYGASHSIDGLIQLAGLGRLPGGAIYVATDVSPTDVALRGLNGSITLVNPATGVSVGLGGETIPNTAGQQTRFVMSVQNGDGEVVVIEGVANRLGNTVRIDRAYTFAPSDSNDEPGFMRTIDLTQAIRTQVDARTLSGLSAINSARQQLGLPALAEAPLTVTPGTLPPPAAGEGAPNGPTPPAPLPNRTELNPGGGVAVIEGGIPKYVVLPDGTATAEYSIDDGSLVTQSYNAATGVSTFKQTFANGSYDIGSEDGNRSAVINSYSATNILTSRTVTSPTPTGSTTDLYNSTNTLLSSTVRQIFDDGTVLDTITRTNLGTDGQPIVGAGAGSSTTLRYTDLDGVSAERPALTNAASDVNLNQVIATSQTILDVGKALFNDSPLGTAQGLTNLIASSSDSWAKLGTGANVIGGISSLISLQRALDKQDTLGALTAGANAINYGNKLYIAAYGANEVTNGINTFLNGTPTVIEPNFITGEGVLITEGSIGALTVLSVINALANNDPIGAGIAIVSAFNPPLGTILSIVRAVVEGIFENEPDPWGVAVFRFTGAADGSIALHIESDDGGDHRVEPIALQAKAQLDQVIATANAQLLAAAAGAGATTALQLGLIPQRMPKLNFHGAYTLVDIDPVSGRDRSLIYDAQGFFLGGYRGDATTQTDTEFAANPYANPAAREAWAGSAEASRTVFEQFIYSSLGRSAIAPLWERQTALIQTQVGDPDAGMTEAVRAARQGQRALTINGIPIDHAADAQALAAWVSTHPNGVNPNNPTDTPPTPRTQVFRPITLDLNGDNRISIVSRTTASVAFDVDDTDFLKDTAWIGAGDGFLVLDNIVNGTIDGGGEVFSNAQVARSRRGLPALDAVDANRDGRITAADPVFSQLRVWQDANQDGVAQAGETKAITELGITALNYRLGTYDKVTTIAGASVTVSSLLQSPELEALTEGVNSQPVLDAAGNSVGIKLTSTGGQVSLLATKLTNLGPTSNGGGGAGTGGGGGSGSGVPGDDGFAFAQEDVALDIPVSALLANDSLGNFNASSGVLSIFSLSNASYGAVELISSGTVVRFTPNANFQGIANFSYTITDGFGHLGAANVSLTFKPVNDAPVVNQTNVFNDGANLIYGYRGIYNYGETDSVTWVPLTAPGIGLLAPSPYFQPDTWMYLDRPFDAGSPQAGRIRASDLDDATLTYRISRQPRYGTAVVDPATGAWRYLPSGITGVSYDTFEVEVVDAGGSEVDASGNPVIKADRVTITAPILPVYNTGGDTTGIPLVLDLDGNGINLVALENSTAFYDIDGDGLRTRMAWVGAGDGFLAYDADGNGTIAGKGEIDFARYRNGAQTDLEGLAAFDSNSDGQLSAADAAFNKFRVWRDFNSNGVSEAGELQTLTEAGIATISLASNGQFAVVAGNTVHGSAVVTMTDGSQTTMADVTLRVGTETLEPTASGLVVTNRPAVSAGEALTGTAADDFVIGTVGNDQLRGLGGNDTIVDDAGNDYVEGGDGDDVIYTGVGEDIILAGNGRNSVFAGAGNDLIVGSADTLGHDLFLGEAGNDIILGGGGNDVIGGGAGDDVLGGGLGNDLISGESGNDALFGNEGDDALSGDSGNDRLQGDSGSDVLDGGTGTDLMLGGAGDDTYVVDFSGDIVREQEQNGTDSGGTDTVRSSISYQLGTNVEILTLTGTDGLNGVGNSLNNTLIGSLGNNVLIGGEGNDVLDGNTGADAMAGGAGDDTYYVDNAGDLVTEEANVAGETIATTNIEALLQAHLSDDLTFQVLGRAWSVSLLANNSLSRADRVLALQEEFGDSDYADEVLWFFDEYAWFFDAIQINGSGTPGGQSFGIDTVFSRVNYSLTPNVEHLVLTGFASINGTGNALNNTLTGNSAANQLDGGAGGDTLIGRGGNDRYVVDDVNDRVVEAAGEGTDTVYTHLTRTLEDHVENAVLLGSSGISATGNSLANLLQGNDAANLLRGLDGNDTLIGNAGDDVLDGGLGADILLGGAGDDTYHVDTAHSSSTDANGTVTTITGDTISEGLLDTTGSLIAGSDAGGTDTVIASINYRLGTNLENLTLTGAATLGIGNDLANILTGNALDNELDGGAAADVMAGGQGDDLYHVDHAGDLVREWLNQGTDSVIAKINYVLPQHVENLWLYANPLDTAGNPITPDAPLQGTGNSLANQITGNAAANVLSGLDGDDHLNGKAGNDSLNGGQGKDTLIGDDGNDVLDGGTERDTLLGGAGDDIYYVDTAHQVTPASGTTAAVTIAGDIVSEGVIGTDGTITAGSNAGGVDLIITTVDYATPDHVENILGAGTGNIQLGGNALNNHVQGNVGNNQLYGYAGNDVMAGGAGNDYLDGGAGNDQLLGQDGDDTLDGGLGVDAMAGGDGNDLLDGGLGADTLVGGRGDDTYILENLGDTVTEAAGDGRDTVRVNYSYTLGTNVENLVLTTLGEGTAASPTIHPTIDGTGNTLDNTIAGNDAANRLSGLGGNDTLIGNGGNDTLDGGLGEDILVGGAGDDLYLVDDVKDVTSEARLGPDGQAVTGSDAGGNDTIHATANHAAGDYIETILVKTTTGLEIAGNDQANLIVGNIGNDKLFGKGGNDVIQAGLGDDFVNGGEGDDTLEADVGNDGLAGGKGDDLLKGGEGHDVYFYDMGDGLDTIVETRPEDLPHGHGHHDGQNPGQGHGQGHHHPIPASYDRVKFGAGLTLANVALRIKNHPDGSFTAQIRVLDANGDEQARQGIDFAVRVDHRGHVSSPIEKFVFADGSEKTWYDLYIKTRSLRGNGRANTLTGGRDDDTIHAGSGGDTVNAGTGHDAVYGGNGDDFLYGDGGDDYVSGGRGNDTLDGGGGTDILDGGAGDDTVRDLIGNNALLGGSGNDRLTAGAGNDFLAGGAGNDTIATGAGNNVVAFNQGDGRDTIVAGQQSQGANNTLSLGEDIAARDLNLRKTGDDLILEIANGDSVTFKDWYLAGSVGANQTFNSLQLVNDDRGGWFGSAGHGNRGGDEQFVVFDFKRLVANFDQARASNTNLNTGRDRWSAMNGLLDAHLRSSTTGALGGELAARYSEQGSLSGMAVDSAQAALNGQGFGQQLQSVHAWQRFDPAVVRIGA